MSRFSAGPPCYDKPHVLVAIVTYNSESVILDCLRAMPDPAVQHAFTYEVVVADNSPRNTTADLVLRFQHRYPRVPITLVRSPENVGWGAGNNLAMQSAHSRPDYVLICNPDASIAAHDLTELAIALQTDPEAAVVAPYVWQGGRPMIGARPDSIATFLFWDLIGRHRAYRRFARRYANEKATFVLPRGYASGAMALFRYSALDDVGFFDPNIFLTSDDKDICRSLRKKGWRVLAAPQAHALHGGGQGSVIDPGTTMASRPALAQQSELVFLEKWYGRGRARMLARYRLRLVLPFRRAIRSAAVWKVAQGDLPVQEVLRGYLKGPA